MTGISKTRTAFGGLYTTKRVTGDFSLVVMDGPHQGEVLRLDREFVRIGRAEWCDLSLNRDDLVSKIHCECMLEERGVRLRDLGSRNGILLGGYQVFDAYLREDGEFKLGNTTVRLQSHHQSQEIEINYQDESGTLVGRGPHMRKLFSMMPRLAQRRVTTLLLGETGTGKTSVARAIHLQHAGEEAPFVVVNCGALPSGLIEAQLFGYEKGAFTGATQRSAGFFQQANGGTLFLDEIAELPIELQPKLLDVIERRKVRPLGSQKEYDVDFHLISATLRNLSAEIEQGKFREDLYFRLSVVELEIPSLSERIEDLNLIIEKMMKELLPDRNVSFTPDAMNKLKRYQWPGNIRELRNILERSVTFLDGNLIGAGDIRLPSQSQLVAPTPTPAELPAAPMAPASPVPAALPVAAPAPAAPQSAPAPFVPAAAPAAPVGAAEGHSALTYLLPPTPFRQNPSFPLKERLADLEKGIIEQALEESMRDVQDASNILEVSPPLALFKDQKIQPAHQK